MQDHVYDFYVSPAYTIRGLKNKQSEALEQNRDLVI